MSRFLWHRPRLAMVWAAVAAGTGAASAFDAPVKPNDDARERNTALTALVENRGPGASDAVLNGLRDPDLGVRQIALANLELAVSDPRMLPALRQQVETAPPQARWMAVRAIALLPPAMVALRDEAVKSARDPDPLIRRALLANVAPGPGVPEVARPLLLAALLGNDPGDRMAAAQSWSRLKWIVPDEVLAGLDADLGRSDPVAAGAAAFALNALWDNRGWGSYVSPVEENVRPLALSGPWTQRVHAADLLRKHQLADASMYAGVFAQGDEADQLYACGTLTRLRYQAVEELLLQAAASRFHSVRQAAVYALGDVGSEASRMALGRLLGSPHPNVRYRTAVVLGRIGPGAAAGKLQSLAATDPDAGVRKAAAIAVASDYGTVLPPLAAIPRPPGAGAARVADPRSSPTDIRDGVVQIGDRKQILVDDLAIASLGGAVRIFHKFKKDPRNPILEQQLPWEYAGLSGTAIVPPESDGPAAGLFRLYYGSCVPAPGPGTSPAGRSRRKNSQMVAVSADGANWTRPNIGLFETGGSRANNLVEMAGRVLPLQHPYEERYRYVSYSSVGVKDTFSLSATFSPDAIKDWTKFRPVLPGAGDVATMGRDDIAGGYFGFNKWRMLWWYGRSFGGIHSPRRLLKVVTAGARSFAVNYGPDPVTLRLGPINIWASAADDRLSPRRVARAFPILDFFAAEEMHAEIYVITPFSYEGVYFGLPSVFYISGPGKANDEGTIDLSLIFSRDRTGASGWNPNGGDHLEPVIDLGRWGEWDAGRDYGPSTLAVINDEIVLYYTGWPNGHESEGWRIESTDNGGLGRPYFRPAIGRATLRLDGFASLHAGTAEASILTKPVAFRGDRLLVNVKGQLAAEILDLNGSPLVGFTRDRCAAFQGDELRHSLVWPGTDLGRLAGTPVRIRFFLKNGDLYSFGFAAPP